MNCPHCQHILVDQGDRHYCVNCSRSIWKGFTMRKGTAIGGNVIGRGIGQYKNRNIK